VVAQRKRFSFYIELIIQKQSVLKQRLQLRK
jgi:hypothetical protein